MSSAYVSSPAPDGSAPTAGSRPEAGGWGLRRLLEDQAARLGERPFLSLGDGRLSFAGTDELANRMAAVLASLGRGPGDIVMARCANTTTMVATWLGCAKLGCVFMPLNSLLTGEPLSAVMALAGPGVAVCDAGLYPELAAAGSRVGKLDHVLVGGGRAPPGTLDLDVLLDAAPSGPPPALVDDPSAPAKLMSTSGTTGLPKGVVWSRACEATWARAYGEELLPVEEGEMVYCCLPLFHITCQGTVLAALVRGGQATIDRRFDPFGFWARVRQSGAVAFSFVGTLLSVLARRPPRPDDADNPVRRIMGSAAPVERWREVEERFGLVIVETWGQTETASCWTRPERLPQRPGTVGRPSPRFQARVVGPGGAEVEPGVPGELWLRPAQPQHMFEGYLAVGQAPGQDGRLPLTREGWTAGGWYRTGDVMVRHPDGELSFGGRLREAIRRRGEMIPAGQIEAAAEAHPAVEEAAAVGVRADDGVEEEVKLCVVPAPGAALSPVELHRFLRERLPKFMVPRYLDLRPELPKTPTTRVRKLALAGEGSQGCWDARSAQPGGNG